MEKSAEQIQKENKKLKEITYEMAFNNSAAIRVLFDIVVRNGLITEENFNKMVKNEAEELKKELQKRVEEAGKL